MKGLQKIAKVACTCTDSHFFENICTPISNLQMSDDESNIWTPEIIKMKDVQIHQGTTSTTIVVNDLTKNTLYEVTAVAKLNYGKLLVQ